MTTAPDLGDAELDPWFGELVASAELAAGFGLQRARLVLAAGSRAEGLADAASDTDFLAVYDAAADLPRVISHPGAIAMPSALGPNWIGEVRGREVNVEAVEIATLDRLAEALVLPLDAARAPLLQPLEVRLLDRMRTGTPVPIGEARVDPRELAALRRRLRVDRLPAVVLVMNYLGALSYLRLAEVRRYDPLGFHVALDAVAEGVALSALCLSGMVLYGMKKVAPALRATERGGLAPPARELDVLEIVAGADPERRIACAWAALGRIEAAIGARAARGDGAWPEAHRAVAGQLDASARGRGRE
ncbi:MAG TPA: hypothetical protein VFT22_19200 [Kofleriaceae bacterium]|nr:hypothetical protein [Kofleriaceae bacterium]